MPLSLFQTRVLQLLAQNRTNESHVAGGLPIAAVSVRMSDDIDIFQDDEEAVESAARKDAATLEDAGLKIQFLKPQPARWSGIVSSVENPAEAPDDTTTLKLEWTHDTAFRFFPARHDRIFGMVLHPADLMINKVLAAAGRSEARDLMDIVELSKTVPIAAAVLAACGKDIGMTPDLVIDNITMFSRHRQEDFDAVRTTERVDGAAIVKRVRQELADLRLILPSVPATRFGKLFLHSDHRIAKPTIAGMGGLAYLDPSRGGIVATAERIPVRDIASAYNRRRTPER
jgi:hypothetical protein